jgi:ATP-binding cassette subfamily B protein
MINLIKYLKASWKAVVAIIIFLFLQANFDLALPDYTARIVNVGIQQNGIEKSIPLVISKESYENIKLFASDDVDDLIDNNYVVYDNDNPENKQTKKYIVDKDLEYYELKKNYNESLEDSIQLPLMIMNAIKSDSEESNQLKEMIRSNVPEELRDEDIFFILKTIDEEVVNELISGIEDSLKELPDSIIKQGAIASIRIEYEKMGIDLEAIQNDYVFKSGLFMLGLALGSMVLTIIVGVLGAIVAARVGRTLRSKLFSKVINFSEGDLKNFSTASLITRSTNDVQQVQTTLVMMLRIVIYAPILGIGGVFKVLETNTSMAWIIALGIGLIMAVIVILIFTVIPKFKLTQKLVDKLNLVSRESLTGLPVIRAFSNQKHEEERFSEANKKIYDNNLFINRVMSFMFPIMMFIMNSMAIVIIWVGAHSISDGLMQIGDMMAFIQYTMQIMMSFLMISMMSIFIPRATVAAGRINEVLNTNNIIDDRKANKSLKKAKGKIEFKNVSFKYTDSDEYVLSNINLTAKPGEVTAIIGSTGCGKSTLVNLIPRFFDVTEGSILVDGIDIKDLKEKDLRKNIGYIPQKGVLFSGTIEENINYGSKKTSFNKTKQAAEIAQADDFINKFDDKYKHIIAQGGSNVSGGQKQRLSIARAIAIDPQIYIFDDSFSALDYKTDTKLRKKLFETTKDKTVLIVAQRISTILNADKIIVLEEGKIVGTGKHSELLKTCNVYKEIADSQLTKEELLNGK